MPANTFLRRLVAGATVLAVAGAGLLVAAPANAQTPPPSGGIAFNPTTGTDLTVVAGTTSGPCDVGDSNALQVFVTGPGSFAPNEATGRPNGVTFRGASTDGFSKTGPNNFDARESFSAFAVELGLSAVPVGDYVVNFRCVDELFLTVFQTYRSTITFTTPTSYVTTTPLTPTPVPPTPTPTPRSGNDLGAISVVVVTLTLVAVAVANRFRKRRSS